MNKLRLDVELNGHLSNYDDESHHVVPNEGQLPCEEIMSNLSFDLAPDIDNEKI
jgi:hypothetical protein